MDRTICQSEVKKCRMKSLSSQISVVERQVELHIHTVFINNKQEGFIIC